MTHIDRCADKACLPVDVYTILYCIITETDVRVCLLHATNITTIGEAREFRKIGNRFIKI
jgi:hypothetical protein